MHKICGLRQEKTRQKLEIRFVSLDFAVNRSYSQATGRVSFQSESRVYFTLHLTGGQTDWSYFLTLALIERIKETCRAVDVTGT